MMTMGHVQMPNGPLELRTVPYVVKIPVEMEITNDRLHFL
jgi:hypothetical protein